MEQTTPQISTPTTPRIPDVFDIIKRSWKFYKENFKRLWVLFLFGSMAGGSLRMSGGRRQVGEMMASHDIPSYVIILAIILVVALSIFFLLSKIALLKSLSDIKKGKFVGIKDAYKKSIHLFWGYVLVSIAGAIAIMGGNFLLFVPGIILAGYLYFAAYEYIHEDKKEMSAFLGSWALVKGRWWQLLGKVFGIAFTLSLIAFCGMIVFGILFTGIGYLGSVVMHEVVVVLFVILILAFTFSIFLIIQPLLVITLFELYLSLKELPLISPPTPLVEKRRTNKILACAVIGALAIITFAFMTQALFQYFQ